MKKTVKFINLAYMESESHPMTMNPGYYMLKSYYNFRGKHADDYVWRDPILSNKITVPEIIDQLIAEKNDVVCLSFFIWNHTRSMMVAEQIKQHLPDTVIVAGGPNLNAHVNQDFFSYHPFIDIVVYGDGEQALVEILDSIYEDRPIDPNSTNSVNIVTPGVVYPHQVFYDKEYNSHSAILDCKPDIARDAKLLQSENKTVHFRWEIARGCPYACSFCDWSSGLHHKVKRKKIDWQAELDFLFSLGLTVSPTDANWGIYKEDVEITEYASTHGSFYVTNTAKLNKDRAFEIHRILFTNSDNAGRSMKLSLQDINHEVLENIDRPEISWEEHKDYIRDFQSQLPDVMIEAELIIGMPGQTVENFLYQVREFETLGLGGIIAYFWELLPNAPAAKKQYQEKFGLQATPLLSVDNSEMFTTIEQIKQSEAAGGVGWSHSIYITETYSCDFVDIVVCKYIAALYSILKRNFPKHSTLPFFDKTLDVIKEESKQIAEQILDSGIATIYNEETGYWMNFDEWFMENRHYKRLLKKSR